MTQDEMKKAVGWAALAYVQPGCIVGVGTGSTVNHFIDALATIKDQVKAAVSSSVASTERLQALGIPVVDLNDVDSFDIYVDGTTGEMYIDPNDTTGAMAVVYSYNNDKQTAIVRFLSALIYLA